MTYLITDVTVIIGIVFLLKSDKYIRMNQTRELSNERCVSGYRYSSSLKSDEYTRLNHTRELYLIKAVLVVIGIVFH